MSSLHNDILALETQTWEALKSSGKAMKPFVAPDCVMIFPGSKILHEQSSPPLSHILDREDTEPWSKYELMHVRVVPLGEEVAMICYEVEAWRGDVLYNPLVTSIWRRRSGSGGDQHGYLMVLHQQTPRTVSL